MTGINLIIFKGNNNERLVTSAKFSKLVGLWLLDLKQSPTELISRSPVCMPGCSCSYPPMSKEALHRGDEDCSDVWIWKFFSILASFQTDFFFAGGTINTSTTSAAGQGVLAPLGSLYCQQIVSQETWWRTWILWVYAPLWDCEGTFVRCLGNDAWKVSWFNQEDLWNDIYLARIRTSDLPLFSPAVLQKKRRCVFFLYFSYLYFSFKVHRFGDRTTGFGVKSTWCSLGTFQQMPTPQQEVWPVPSMSWEFQNGHERLGWMTGWLEKYWSVLAPKLGVLPKLVGAWSSWRVSKNWRLMASELLVG